MRVTIRIQSRAQAVRQSGAASSFGLQSIILTGSVLSCITPIVCQAGQAHSAAGPRWLLTLLALEAVVCLMLLIGRGRRKIHRLERRQAWALSAVVREGRL